MKSANAQVVLKGCTCLVMSIFGHAISAESGRLSTSFSDPLQTKPLLILPKAPLSPQAKQKEEVKKTAPEGITCEYKATIDTKVDLQKISEWETEDQSLASLAEGVNSAGYQLFSPRFDLSISGRHLNWFEDSDWALLWKGKLVPEVANQGFGSDWKFRLIYTGFENSQGTSIFLGRMAGKILRKTALTAGEESLDSAFFRSNALTTAFHHSGLNRFQVTGKWDNSWFNAWGVDMCWSDMQALKLCTDPTNENIQYRGSTSHLGFSLSGKRGAHAYQMHFAPVGWLKSEAEENALDAAYQSSSNQATLLPKLNCASSLWGAGYTWTLDPATSIALRGGYVFQGIHWLVKEPADEASNKAAALYTYDCKHAMDLSAGFYRKNILGLGINGGAEFACNYFWGIQPAEYSKSSRPSASLAPFNGSKDCYAGCGFSKILSRKWNLSGVFGFKYDLRYFRSSSQASTNTHEPFAVPGYKNWSSPFSVHFGLESSKKSQPLKFQFA